MMPSTQLLGFALAGICRCFLVKPPAVIWFYVLSQLALNNALLNQFKNRENGWKISQFKYFFIVFSGAFW